MSYALDIKKFCEQTSANVDEVARTVTLDLLTRIVNKTPVLHGYLRANWQVSATVPMTSKLDATDPSGQATIGKAGTLTARMRGVRTWFITNNLPYARRCEYGWSQQAPQGMVRLSINEIQSQFDAIAREIASGRQR